MERPSHIDISTHQSLLQRLPILALAISLQIAIAWLFTSGLVNRVIHIVDHTFELVPITKTKLPPVEPPKPNLKTPTKITVVIPKFTTSRDPGEKIIIGSPPEPNIGTSPLPPATVTRAPVSIAATHTIPPYPVVARRVGWEGKVTLRLAVLTNGHVGKAEVVNSSGRGDLDDAAQAWIVAHWLYKPALDHDVPAVGQAIAIVTFSLENMH